MRLLHRFGPARASLLLTSAVLVTAACGSSDDASQGDVADGGTTVDGAHPGTDGGTLGGDDATLPDAGPPLPTCDPGAGDVAFTIDATSNVHAISRFIYGTNFEDQWQTPTTTNLTIARSGGNRWTAYNWENNASNAGSDYMYENDNFLGGGSTPGEAVRSRVAASFGAGASHVVTIPMQGWVSADETGPVSKTLTNLPSRFKASKPNKGAAAVYPPDVTDANVYQDEFVTWLEKQFPGARTDPAKTIFYMLDNEPDLWLSTHAEIQKTAETYADLLAKSVATSAMIKRVAPGALVFGPVNYGWEGYVNLQTAPDANGRDFLEFFLDGMKAAENGGRIFDVLDLHWYPEATGGGTRIIDDGDTPSDALVDARLQAPRSLWDDTYTETSWITDAIGKKPIRLIPLMLEKIAAHSPGTKLAFSEYHYGGANHISGGIAEADALGVFGREGVFMATEYPLQSTEDFIYGGFAMFRNFDGQRGAFGDTSIAATTTDNAKSSVYASLDTAHPGRMVVVAINKTRAAVNASVKIAYGTSLTKATAYQLTSASKTPALVAAPPTPNCQAFLYAMPPMSVTTIVLE